MKSLSAAGEVPTKSEWGVTGSEFAANKNVGILEMVIRRQRDQLRS